MLGRTRQGERTPGVRLGLALALALGLVALIASWAAWRMGWLGNNPVERVVLLVLAGIWNTALLMAALAAWQGIAWRGILRARLERELRDLRGLGGEEGRVRLQGLIRELNRLDAAPAMLEGALLDGADLSGADLRCCDLRGALLRGVNLHGALLDGADLSGAELAGADLSRASLKGSQLERANLEDGQMAKAEVTGANLRRANLINLNLYGTSLRGVNLERARFAHRHAGEWESEVHASVEDWIRERLDDEGTYEPLPRNSAAGGK